MSIQSRLFLTLRTPVPAKGDMDWVKLDRIRTFWLVKCGQQCEKRLQVINLPLRVYT